jgi:hypothetical protein
MLSFLKHDSTPSPLCPRGSGPEPLSVWHIAGASPSQAPLPGLLPLYAQGIHGRADPVESKRAESLSPGSLKAWRVAMDAAEASERNTVHNETHNPSPSPSRNERTLASQCVQSLFVRVPTRIRLPLSPGSLKAWRVAMDAAEASERNTVHNELANETLNPSPRAGRTLPSPSVPEEALQRSNGHGGCSRVDAPLLCDTGTPVFKSTQERACSVPLEPRITAEMYAVASPAPLLRDSGTPVFLSPITQEHPDKLVACLLSCIREAQERAEELESGLREWAAKAQLHQERQESKGSSCRVGAQHLHLEMLANLQEQQVALAAREQVITSKDAEIEHLKSRHQDVLAGECVCVIHAHTHTQAHIHTVTTLKRVGLFCFTTTHSTHTHT